MSNNKRATKCLMTKHTHNVNNKRAQTANAYKHVAQTSTPNTDTQPPKQQAHKKHTQVS